MFVLFTKLDSMKHSLFTEIREDILRIQRLDNRCIMRLIWDFPGLKAVLIYRLGRWLLGLRRNPIYWPCILLLLPIYWVLSTYMRLANDIFIDNSAVIGPGFYIGHFGGIKVRKCQLGANCSIQQEVRLGPLTISDYGPIIGDNVWIGAHSRIEGPFKIGDGATIGAGSLVTHDVAARSLVLGNPARVIQKDFDNSLLL
jgi:serine O-acetyltransferase